MQKETPCNGMRKVTGFPHEMGNEQWTFTRKAMNYVHEQIVMKKI